MNRTAAAFVAGAVTTAAALLYSNLHGPAAAFAAGFLMNLIALVAFLASRKRRRTAAAIMARIAGVERPERAERTAKAAQEPAAVSAVEQDVTDALVGLKVKRATAAAAARRAVEQLPAGTFDQVFRIAVPFAKA